MWTDLISGLRISKLKTLGFVIWRVLPIRNNRNRGSDKRHIATVVLLPMTPSTIEVLTKMGSMMERIVLYENGTLSGTESIKLFQDLIDSGLAFGLNTKYSKMACELIALGKCHPAAWPD